LVITIINATTLEVPACEIGSKLALVTLILEPPPVVSSHNKDE
jgi:hypothetical protein